MFKLNYVENDALRTEEFKENDRDVAIEKWLWARSQPDITEVELSAMTVDVTFPGNSKEYTYLCEEDLSEYGIVDMNPELVPDDLNKVFVYIKRSGYKTILELKKKSGGRFKFKPLRGIPYYCE